jgi:hypothetical protein
VVMSQFTVFSSVDFMFLAATVENKFVEIEGVLFLYCYVYGQSSPEII